MMYCNIAFKAKMGQFGIAFAVLSIKLLLDNSEVSAANLPITDIKDGSFASETVTRVGNCYQNGTLIEISVNPFNTTPLIATCHDEATGFTYWSRHYIYGTELKYSEGGGRRPTFQQSDFYRGINVDDCYKQTTQTETIGRLVGSTKLAKHYVQTTRNLSLSRGHLAPRGDPIKAEEKNATFYFINASPQWQTINGGNWEALEAKVRDIANATRSTLTVWTGSYGIMKLDNVHGNPVEIWLGKNSGDGELVRKLPVNQLTWKVIHNPTKKRGVAIIQVNNPWMESIPDSDILCEDVCDKLDWITWNTTDIVRGYTYCCTVQSFREKVDYAPDLGNLLLLQSKSRASGGGIVNTAAICISLIIWFLFTSSSNPC